MRRTWWAATILCGLTLLSIAREARAGAVPPSALARALSLDPRLVDSSMLIFRFPQLVAGRDSAALAFGRRESRSELFVSTTGAEYGLGAALRERNLGGFATTQLGYLPTESGLSYVDIPYNGSNVLQLGGGGRWRSIRVGAALRGTQFRRERSEVTESNSEYVERAVAEHLEGALGAGISGRGATLDAVFEWGGTTYETGMQYVTPYDTLVVRLDGEPEGESSFAVRLTAPAGSRMRIVATGESRWGDVTWSGQEFRDQQLRPIVRTDRSKVWFTGLCFLFAAPHLDCMAVSGTFEHRDETLVASRTYEGLMVTRRKLDYATLALSVERGLWRTLVAQAGFNVSYSRDYAEDSFARSEETRLRAAREEHIQDGFACGLSYAWRTFQLASNLNVPPRLSTPIAMIDVSVGF